MRSDDNTFYREDDHSLVKRYEKMRREKTRSFFDVHEFENIIDYYLEMNKLVKASLAVKCGLAQHPGSVGIQIRKANLLIDKGKYGKTRDELYDLLKSKNIYARRYFYPLISNF